MPDLFPDPATYVLCAITIAGAQVIYAAAGFGAGMFAIAVLALFQPDLAPVVATLFLLTLTTEVWVIARSWKSGRPRLVVVLLPSTLAGMWIGTRLLVTTDTVVLSRVLGVVVGAAGIWLLRRDREAGERRPPTERRPPVVVGVFVGLLAGTLGGLFGTAAPPVVAYLHRQRLGKSTFRATLIWYFFTLSVMRAGTYLAEGLVSSAEVAAALWLLPPSVAGTLLGFAVHRRVSERVFRRGVAWLLTLLGVVLAAG